MQAVAATDKNDTPKDDIILAEPLELLGEYVEKRFNIDPDWVWVTEIFIIILCTLTASFLANRSLERLRVRLKHTDSLWDDTLVEAARKPVRTGIWLLGICYAIEIVYANTHAVIFSAIGTVRSVGIISIFTWWLLRFVEAFEHIVVQRKQARGEVVEHATIQAVSKLIKASVLITSGLVMLQTLGFSISGLLAFGGMGGIAMGFAAKDLLANFFGALTIYYDRPFSVGDWIRSPDKNIEGTVEYIGWRQTRIRTFERRPLYVPNALFTTIVVENPSRMSHRRIYETIGIRLEDVDKMQAITDDVREMVIAHPEIDETQLLMVQFNTFGTSSADFMVYCFTHTKVWVEFQAVKQDVLLKIVDIIQKHGAKVAVPVQRVKLEPWQLAAEGEIPVQLEEKPATKKRKKPAGKNHVASADAVKAT